ncbi:MAG: 30S ribosomal protein S6 [Patescibacteria group bacterium]
MSSDTIKNDELRIYEVGYLFVPSVPQERIGEEIAALTEQITNKGASILAHEDPELRPLAYTILKKVGAVNERFNQAYFGWVKFEMEPAQIDAIKKWMDENSNVLRYLLTTTVRENTYLGKKSSPVIAKEEAVEAVAEAPKVEAAVEGDKVIEDTAKSA